MSRVRVDRCVCDRVTFVRLFEIARRAGAKDVAALREAARDEGVFFGRTCGLCVPYVRTMLETGETVFDRLIVDEG